MNPSTSPNPPSPRKRDDLCQECALSLLTVAPRRIVTITETSKLPPQRSARFLSGRYCSSDCALNACHRGRAKTVAFL